jgi:hypothetical protein
LSLCLTNESLHHEGVCGVDVYIHIFSTSILVGSEWLALRPGCLNPEERAPGTLCVGEWVDPRTGLGDRKKTKFLTLPELELRPLGRRTCS